jgi:hypothetical protein
MNRGAEKEIKKEQEGGIYGRKTFQRLTAFKTKVFLLLC